MTGCIVLVLKQKFYVLRLPEKSAFQVKTIESFLQGEGASNMVGLKIALNGLTYQWE